MATLTTHVLNIAAGTPAAGMRIELRSSANPFEGKHKPLTEKQDAMRRRRKIISKRRYG